MTHRILVIEDEPAIVDTIRYALVTEGFSVTWAPTLAAARNLMPGASFSLLVLDVGLPDGNGFDFCREIRRTSDLPIIFLTARSEEIDRIVGLEMGGDDYMVKPFSPRELSARVRAVLRRTQDSASDNGSIDSNVTGLFVLDEPRKQIRYSGVVLELSRYEYRILKQLIQRPGWVFSRDDLMNRAWEEPDASMQRTVDTHIKTLRAKLRSIQPGQDPIQTHRGLGYSLREDL